jgi:hypothetical protein
MKGKRGLKHISRRDPLNRRSLGFARDDKGDGDTSMKSVFCPAGTFDGSFALPFVIPSEAEGSAV